MTKVLNAHCCHDAIFFLLPPACWVPLSVLSPKAASSGLPQQAQPVCWLQQSSFVQSCWLSSAVLLLRTFIVSQAQNYIHSSEIVAGANLSLAWPYSYYLCVIGAIQCRLDRPQCPPEIVSTSVTVAGNEGGTGMAQNRRDVASLSHGEGSQGCDSVPERKSYSAEALYLSLRSLSPLLQTLL